MDIHEKLREINKNRKNNPTFFESPNITFQHSIIFYIFNIIIFMFILEI